MLHALDIQTLAHHEIQGEKGFRPSFQISLKPPLEILLEEHTSLMWGKKYKYGKVRGKSLTVAATKDLKKEVGE